MLRSKSEAAVPAHRLDLAEVLQWLQADGLIDKTQYNWLIGSAVEHQRKGTHPLAVIAQMNWSSASQPPFLLAAERLSRWLANRVGLPHLLIDPLKTDFSRLTPYISYAYASRFGILPVSLKDDELTVATPEPYITEWVTELEHALHKRIRRVFANPLDIARYLHEFYKLQYSIQGAGNSDKLKSNTPNNFEQLLELGKTSGEVDVGDQHIIQIVDWLLQYAFEQRASDIHMEPRREQGNIRFRIDGKLHLIHELPPPVMTAMTSRIKLLGRMNLAERRRPQDGRIKTVAPDTGRNVELRLSTMPTAFGEKLVLRIFDPEVLVKDFSALGLSKRDIHIWRQMLARPHGVLLVTGPTGSGKTSTLYSTLRHLHQPEINICTIEDPIEIVDERFNQMQTQHSIGLDFATGVRTLLRQDPDIIMVGEIRDRETAEVSIQAALTGHLVLSTLHTNDAPSAITRLQHIGLPTYLINAALIGVVAQRLVRVLCVHCKTAVAPDAALWQSLVTPRRIAVPAQVYQAVGCEHCRHTGFRGRIGLYEIMPMTASLQALSQEQGTLQALHQQALKEGLCPLRLSGAAKIAAGLTTFAEVFNVVSLANQVV